MMSQVSMKVLVGGVLFEPKRTYQCIVDGSRPWRRASKIATRRVVMTGRHDASIQRLYRFPCHSTQCTEHTVHVV